MRERRPTGLIKNRPRGRSARGVARAARGVARRAQLLATNQSVGPINDIFIIYLLLLLLLLFIYCTVRLY